MILLHFAGCPFSRAITQSKFSKEKPDAETTTPSGCTCNSLCQATVEDGFSRVSVRVLFRFEFHVSQQILYTTLATDKKWPLTDGIFETGAYEVPSMSQNPINLSKDRFT